MKIQITAGGIYGAPTEGNPTGELPIGAELTVDDMPAALAGRYTVLSGGEGKTLTVNPAVGSEGHTGPVAPFLAKDTGGGWWTITDVNGQAVGKKLRAADAEAFNGLSEEDKAEFLKGEG